MFKYLIKNNLFNDFGDGREKRSGYAVIEQGLSSFLYIGITFAILLFLCKYTCG